jgi:hypothetical protein
MKKILIVVLWLVGLGAIAWWNNGPPTTAHADSSGREPSNTVEQK